MTKASFIPVQAASQCKPTYSKMTNCVQIYLQCSQIWFSDAPRYKNTSRVHLEMIAKPIPYRKIPRPKAAHYTQLRTTSVIDIHCRLCPRQKIRTEVNHTRNQIPHYTVPGSTETRSQITQYRAADHRNLILLLQDSQLYTFPIQTV